MKQEEKRGLVIDAKLKLLFILALEGDSDSYRDFLDEVYQLMHKFINTNQHSYHLSSEFKEEIIQEILTKIHKNKASYNIQLPITPWLFAIARNCIVDELRKTKNNNTNTDHNLENIETSYFQTEAIVDARQELEHLLSLLPKHQQNIILLSKYYGHESSEIAKLTKLSLSAVKVKIFRSLKVLRKHKEHQ